MARVCRLVPGRNAAAVVTLRKQASARLWQVLAYQGPPPAAGQPEGAAAASQAMVPQALVLPQPQLAEVKDLQILQLQLEKQIDNAKTELKAEIGKVTTELKAEIGKVTTELKTLEKYIIVLVVLVGVIGAGLGWQVLPFFKTVS